MNGDRGDIAAIPFPFADKNTYKRRPVVVLTSPDRHGDIICLAVTSVPTSEHAVAITNDALTQGKLPKPSWIRCDKVFTLSVKTIVKTYGRLDAGVLNMARDGFCQYMGCRHS